MVRGLDDLNPIADLPTLEYLYLQTLNRVTTLPSFIRCTQLARVHLESMKGLTDRVTKPVRPSFFASRLLVAGLGPRLR